MRSFWESSWESVDPDRIAAYIDTFDKEKVIETKDLILRQGLADDWQDLYRNL